MTSLAKRNGAALMFLLLLLPSPAASGQLAAAASDTARAKTYGADDDTSVTVNAFEFWFLPSGTQTIGPEDFMRGVAVASPSGFIGGVRLPNGAQIRYLQMTACDDDQSQDLSTELLACDDTDIPSTCASLAFVGTVGTAPGCTLLTGPVPAQPATVDNARYSYFLGTQLAGTGTGGTLRFRSVRVFYRLQVSAPPAVATFNDVPVSDGAFAFVEALAASGITVGCSASPPLYCPDAPLTRRQMAVFLAKGLGLHWPN